MTIEERIEELIAPANNLASEDWIRDKLAALLEQVAKEQREICLKNAAISISSEGNGSIIDLNENSILNAPSPLNG